MKDQELKQKLEIILTDLITKTDPNDSRDIFLEIRAGTGGDEAAIFAGDLYRMYTKFTEKNSWSSEIISLTEGDHGGYKEIIIKITGSNVYGEMKFESGTHRRSKEYLKLKHEEEFTPPLQRSLFYLSSRLSMKSKSIITISESILTEPQGLEDNMLIKLIQLLESLIFQQVLSLNVKMEDLSTKINLRH